MAARKRPSLPLKPLLYLACLALLILLTGRYSNQLFQLYSSLLEKGETEAEPDIEAIRKASEGVILNILREAGVVLEGRLDFEKRVERRGGVTYPFFMLRVDLPEGVTVEDLKKKVEGLVAKFPHGTSPFITTPDPVSLTLRLWYGNLLLYRITFDEDPGIGRGGEGALLALLAGVRDCREYESFDPFLHAVLPISYEISPECGVSMKYAGRIIESGGETVMDISGTFIAGRENLIDSMRGRLLSLPELKGVSIPLYTDLKGFIPAQEVIRELRLFLFLKGRLEEDASGKGEKEGLESRGKWVDGGDIDAGIPLVKGDMAFTSLDQDLANRLTRLKRIAKKRGNASAYILLKGAEDGVVKEIERATSQGFTVSPISGVAFRE